MREGEGVWPGRPAPRPAPRKENTVWPRRLASTSSSDQAPRSPTPATDQTMKIHRRIGCRVQAVQRPWLARAAAAAARFFFPPVRVLLGAGASTATPSPGDTGGGIPDPAHRRRERGRRREREKRERERERERREREGSEGSGRREGEDRAC